MHFFRFNRYLKKMKRDLVRLDLEEWALHCHLQEHFQILQLYRNNICQTLGLQIIVYSLIKDEDEEDVEFEYYDYDKQTLSDVYPNHPASQIFPNRPVSGKGN